MANEITKCPICGTKLKMKDGRMSCQKCGYYLRNQNESADFLNAGRYGSAAQYGSSSQYGASGQAGYTGQTSAPGYGTSGQAGYTGQTGTSGQTSAPGYGTSGQTGYSWQPGSSGPSSSSGWQTGTGAQNRTSQSSPQKKNTAAIAAISVVVGVILLAAVCIIVMSTQFAAPERDTMSAEASQSTMSSGSSSASAQGTAGTSAQETTGSSAEETARARFPQSDFFRQVAEAIWGKAYRTISAEEYASLTAIQINQDDKSIRYWLDDQDYQVLSYQNNIGMDLADLASFPGLGWISVDDDLQKGDLKGLNNLYGVYAENTIDELLEIVPNPENITELGIEDSIFNRTLDGLESFPNLQYLYVDYESLEDISALLQFPDLIGLALLNCDDVTDYSPLMSLTGLDELSIESSQLKSIDFVRNMPLLTKLSIEDSQISNLSALESCPQLTSLSLIDNYGIDDYSIVGQLTQLTDLTLEMGSGGVLPSFANLGHLNWLTLKYAGDLSPLRDATNVTYLSIEECSGWELDAIASMQQLDTVVIHDFSSYVSSLEPLTRLPNLTTLSLEDTSVFGNVEEIFGIPTLQYLYMNECQIGLDFENLPGNEALSVLSLNDTDILYDPTYNNGGRIPLSEHTDIFERFPNLTELYLASQELENIDFVEKLPGLMFLDITDNSVTSLKPLENLGNFRAVWCGQNTILENVSADSNIIVYMD